MNNLYPLKFESIFKDKIWGGTRLRESLNKQGASDKCGESWEISAVQGNISVVSNGFLAGNNLQDLIEVYMGDLVGDKIYDKFGIEFPLLVKFIDANDKLSIQVHPDDGLAMERHNAYGKTEMWYIVKAEKDAQLISGFNRILNKESYLDFFNQNRLVEIMNFEEAGNGDVFFTPAGRVHAILSGILLAEIQQTSDITYRIYDWDRTDAEGKSRELHTGLALDALDFNHYEKYRTEYEPVMNQTVNIADCPYFTTGLIHFDKPVEKDFNFIDSFVIYMCIEGGMEIIYSGSLMETIKVGESVLVPAALKDLQLRPVGESKVLEIYIK
jgi:mannose-6-phosphate isomerase